MRQTLTVIILGLLCVEAHGATVVYDTLSHPGSNNFYIIGVSPVRPAAPPRSTAMQFVPSQGGFLTAVDVRLNDIIGVDWSASASIYPDVGGLPGMTALESILFAGGPAGFVGVLSLPATGTTWLDPAQTYWLGLAPKTPGMFVGWRESGLATIGPNKAQTWPALNGFWFNILPNLNQAEFLISVNTTVPVTPAIWLFISALGFLGCVRLSTHPRRHHMTPIPLTPGCMQEADL